MIGRRKLLSLPLYWITTTSLLRTSTAFAVPTSFQPLLFRQGLEQQLSLFANPCFSATTTTTTARTMASSSSSGETPSVPIGIIVQAQIQPDRWDEFWPMIVANAEASRQEPGCLRFDVLRSQDDPHAVFFYEVYENAAAIDHHKQQAHYQKWADFKASGGTVSSVTYKTHGSSLTTP